MSIVDFSLFRKADKSEANFGILDYLVMKFTTISLERQILHSNQICVAFLLKLINPGFYWHSRRVTRRIYECWFNHDFAFLSVAKKHIYTCIQLTVKYITG